MFGFIHKLLGKQEEPVEVPLEELTTTIAFPDGSRRSNYPAESTNHMGSKVKAAVAEIGKRHPKVADRITLTWGDRDCGLYLNSLLFDERAMDKDHNYSARAGFSPEIMSLIMTVQEEHQRRFGNVEELSRPVIMHMPENFSRHDA